MPVPVRAECEAAVIAWMRRACEGGDGSQCATIAMQYLEGRGVARDEDLADELAQRGCSEGHQASCQVRDQIASLRATRETPSQSTAPAASNEGPDTAPEASQSAEPLSTPTDRGRRGVGAAPWVVHVAGLVIGVTGLALDIAAYARYSAGPDDVFSDNSWSEWDAGVGGLSLSGDVLVGLGATLAVVGLIWLLIRRARIARRGEAPALRVSTATVASGLWGHDAS